MPATYVKPAEKPSPLQWQILDLAARDSWLKSYGDVAERLGRSRETVKNAIHRLRRKL